LIVARRDRDDALDIIGGYPWRFDGALKQDDRIGFLDLFS
jgi:hypothetical protein